jgi:hypothetical protein
MSKTIIDVYDLLPVVYRLRDAERGYPLKALLEIVAQQADIVKRDIDGLWDDFFIETCAEWVIPYIGDLVGNDLVHDVAQRSRADVAKTIYYRRRKGVLPMLEELARDVTGWDAHAVAAFENLGWTQNVNHVRYTPAPDPEERFPHAFSRVGTVNLRDVEGVDRLDGPFDTISHTVDVRPADQVVGRHNIRKITFFLWRLQQFPLTRVPAREAAAFANGYHVGPLRNPAPLFTNPKREAVETELATEIHVPGPIRPAAFHFGPADYYGPGQSLVIYRRTAGKWQRIPQDEILCKNLSIWSKPSPGKVAVDVQLGRCAFADGQVPDPRDIAVSYNYSFSAALGGGPYDRAETLRGFTDHGFHVIPVAKEKPGAHPTLQAALSAWDPAQHPETVIEIQDNGVYGGVLSVALPDGVHLAIVARDGCRPDVRPVGRWRIHTPANAEAAFTLDGLLVEGSLHVCGKVDATIAHCTLVPGRTLGEDGLAEFPDLDSLLVATMAGICESLDTPRVTIRESITGPLRLPAACEKLTVRDSIVDAPAVMGTGRPAIAADDAANAAGPPTTIERSTVWGEVYVRALTASETIFNDRVRVERLQTGCVRFSYVTATSTTPRRYRCQPDLALQKEAQRLGLDSVQELPPARRTAALVRLRPTYTAIHYGDPGYAQLSRYCADAIRTGAADGSEMGVFQSLKQPQRETNLRIRLEEYLPFGLEPGLIYVT